MGLLLQRPLKTRDQDIACLLRVGLYQLDAMAVPSHAAVAATVAAARELNKAWATGLLNAALRRFTREQDALVAAIRTNEAATTLFPAWLLTRLKTAWPEHWQHMVAASNAKPPMFLRVNRLRVDLAHYLELLEAAGIVATPFNNSIPPNEAGITLQAPLPVSRLPGFADGMVSVQDAGAQLAAQLLLAEPGQRVLDACAAPGGKAAHLQEIAHNGLELTALDKSPERLQTLSANLDRLGIRARAHVADASNPRGSWAEQRYDRILLDAPCSGTGVIRRHPDIKWLRHDQDIDNLAELQARLLDALWPLLAEGGIVLYVTCSVLPEENDRQIASFLARTPQARALPLAVERGIACAHGHQLLPTVDGPDGFYFARLAKG